MVMHFFNITPKLFSLDNLPAYLLQGSYEKNVDIDVNTIILSLLSAPLLFSKT